MIPNGSSQPRPFQLSGFRVEPRALRVIGADGQSRIEAKTMQVLVYLSQHPGEVISRAELEARLWPGRVVTDDAVTNTIAKLRRVFGDDARRPRIIETVPKSGYRLLAEPAPLEPAGDAATGLPPRSGPNRLRRWVLAALGFLLTAVVAWWFSARTGFEEPPTAAAKPKPSLAILPFENLGPSPEQDYFASGITADLITHLSKLSGLLVIAPGSVFAYRGEAADPRRIAAELAVEYVVTGSVQRLGERLRINVRLIEVPKELASHLPSAFPLDRRCPCLGNRQGKDRGALHPGAPCCANSPGPGNRSVLLQVPAHAESRRRYSIDSNATRRESFHRKP